MSNNNPSGPTPVPPDPLPPQELIARFERAWDQEGKEPTLHDYLPADEPTRRTVLVDLVRIDLQRRLQAGESVRVEKYLHAFPDLATDQSKLFELLVAEYAGRMAQGKPPRLEEYYRRFPTHKDALEKHFQAVKQAGTTGPKTVMHGPDVTVTTSQDAQPSAATSPPPAPQATMELESGGKPAPVEPPGDMDGADNTVEIPGSLPPQPVPASPQNADSSFDSDVSGMTVDIPASHPPGDLKPAGASGAPPSDATIDLPGSVPAGQLGAVGAASTPPSDATMDLPASHPPTEAGSAAPVAKSDFWGKNEPSAVPSDHTVDLPGSVPPSEKTPVSGVGSAQPSDPYMETLDKYDASGPAVAAGMSSQAGVPGYEILGELGRGGMGVVYKARQKGLKRLVALKMILAGAHAGAQQLARFKLEAEAVALLQHPNIVQVYEVGEYDNLPFFSLEFIDGGCLANQLEGTPQSPQRAAQMIEVLARAMDVAHQKGVIHRDLKPANVLLTMEGTPKITDFGLAKKLDDVSGHTAAGSVMGTPSYMPPEQAAGKVEELGPPADIYSLGAILYEMITGRPPFKAATPLETIMQVANDDPVPPSQLQPRTPRDLETICLKCLQKEPPKRYPSAADLADDLRRYLNHEPILARPVSPAEKTIKWIKRYPSYAALIGVSTLVLLGLIGLVIASYDQRLRVAEMRNKGQGLVSHGRSSLSEGKWQDAIDAFDEALRLVGSDKALEDLRREAQILLDDAKLRQEEQVQGKLAKDAAEKRYQDFLKRRGDALFYAAYSLSDRTEKSLTEAQRKAQEALEVAQESVNRKERPSYLDYLDALKQSQMTEGCFELFMVQAEIQAQLDPKRVSESLKMLERAQQLVPPKQRPPQAYFKRLENYNRIAGKVAEAQEAQRNAAGGEPATALDFFLLGEQYQREEKFREAIREFENALEKDHNHYGAHFFLAICHLRQNEPATARAHLTACLAQGEDILWIYLMRGFASIQIKDMQAARRDFQIAQIAHDRNKDDRDQGYVLSNNLAILLLGEEKFDEAIAMLNEAIGLDREKYQAYISLAKAYQLQKKLPEAIAQFNKAIATAEKLPEKQRLDAVTMSLLHRNRAKLHLEFLQEVRSQCLIPGVLHPEGAWALPLFERQEYTASLRDFEQAGKLLADAKLQDTADEGWAKSLTGGGQILHRCKRYREALANYDRVLKVYPDFTEAHRWRAEALLRLNEYAGAVAAFNRYLATGGQRKAEIFRVRGSAKEKLADLRFVFRDGAWHETTEETARDKLAELRSFSWPAVQAAELISLSSGGAFLSVPWVDVKAEDRGSLLAIDDYNRALEIDPNDGPTYTRRARAYLVCQSYQPALRDFDKSLEFDRTNTDAYLGRAFALIKLNRTPEGLADVERAVKIAPANSQLLYKAARIHGLAVSNLDAALGPRVFQIDAKTLRQRTGWHDRTLDLIGRALEPLDDAERSKFWKEKVESDTAFDSLRRSLAYSRLEAKYAPRNGRLGRRD